MMLKKGINEPPRNAPHEFQLEFLEKLERVRQIEKLDEKTLMTMAHINKTNEFF
jgi:hypothetical protein